VLTLLFTATGIAGNPYNDEALAASIPVPANFRKLRREFMVKSFDINNTFQNYFISAIKS
jgi:hypothetical protein